MERDVTAALGVRTMFKCIQASVRGVFLQYKTVRFKCLGCFIDYAGHGGPVQHWTRAGTTLHATRQFDLHGSCLLAGWRGDVTMLC